MQSQPSAPLLEDILQALGDKAKTVDRTQIEEELQRYLDYGVPPAQARATILRHHGVQAPRADASAAGRRTLAEVQPNESFVNLLVRVVAINEKEIEVRGEKRRIQYGILGDESMTRPFTAWKPIEAKKGDVLKLVGAYTREFRGQAEVQLGDRVAIESAPADALPATPVARALKVADLQSGMSNVEITARVLTVAPRQVNVQGAPKTVWSGLLGDETGKAGFTSWSDFHLADGQAVRIKGGYVRSFRAAPQFTFDEKSTVEVLASDAVPSLDQIASGAAAAVADLYTGQGVQDVTVEATLVEVRPGSGLIQRCPECRRSVTAGECRTHGKVKGANDLRIKAVLDDGTGAVNVVFARETTEALLGKTLDECLTMAKEALTSDVVEREIASKLVARPFRVRGDVLVDDFGPTLFVREAAFLHRDLAAAAEALLAELEEAA